jgi:hypothetical protein
MVMPPARRHALLIACVAAGLVLAGHLFAAQAVRHLGYDSTFYVAMAEGRSADVPAPFKFRVVVPLVASWLPLTAPDALRLITYLSLFGTYCLVIQAGLIAGLSLRASAFGLLSVWGSTWHLYNYYNPYMTDGAGLLALSAMVASVLTGAFPMFAAAAIAGVLVRELTIVLVPAWFATRQTRQALLIVAAAAVAVGLPRYWLSADGDLGAALVDQNPLTQFPLSVLARQLYAIWGFVWVLAIAGFFYLPAAYRPRILAMFAALFLGGLAASTVATDTGRMFAFLAPVMAIGCAQLYEVLARRSRALAWSLVAAMALQGIVNAPAVMLNAQHWIVGWPRRIFLAGELVLGGLIITALRRRRTNLHEGQH